VNRIRFTVIDRDGAISFVGPCHAIKMLVAACSRHPRTATELLEFTRPYDAVFVTDVMSGLTVFDEHNTPENPESFHAVISHRPAPSLPPFRVFDERTREASLTPVTAGLIVFNLTERRIIQVQNSYDEIRREDRGRIWRDGRATRALYRYHLPDEWSIVP
jgi:hypothetical protein